jgi:hypothetical protein
MAPIEVNKTAVSMAFCWMQINRINIMPFNCMMCMSGWLSMITAFLFGYGIFAFLFFFVGCLAGALLENFMRRYL